MWHDLCTAPLQALSKFICFKFSRVIGTRKLRNAYCNGHVKRQHPRIKSQRHHASLQPRQYDKERSHLQAVASSSIHRPVKRDHVCTGSYARGMYLDDKCTAMNFFSVESKCIVCKIFVLSHFYASNSSADFA